MNQSLILKVKNTKSRSIRSGWARGRNNQQDGGGHMRKDWPGDIFGMQDSIVFCSTRLLCNLPFLRFWSLVDPVKSEKVLVQIVSYQSCFSLSFRILLPFKHKKQTIAGPAYLIKRRMKRLRIFYYSHLLPCPGLSVLSWWCVTTMQLEPCYSGDSDPFPSASLFRILKFENFR